MAPFTDHERQQITELHAQGHGRNEISRQTGIHNRRVSAIAADLGLSFSRAGATAAATEAKKADGAARRARLQEEALTAAQKLMGQMFAPTTVYNFGGKENDYNSREHPEPPFADKRNIATAIQALAATALKLAEYDKATGSEEERGMLGDLRDQLRAARDSARSGQ